MPMVKPRGRKIGCSVAKGIKWYLEEKVPGRALARGFCNVLSTQKDTWDKAFDHTRIVHKNHLPYHGHDAVQYTHIPISPDPRDNLTPEEVLEYALGWSRHFFGDGGESGKFGCFQCAVVIHDDNENGVVHAHVVVNNTNLDTGDRLHLNDTENAEIADFAQDLARERGWHYFDNTRNHDWIAKEAHLPLEERRAMLPEGSTKTIAERRLEERGEAVWKNELRTKVGVSKNVSQTEEEFIEVLNALGIKAHFNEENRDYTFGLNREHEELASTGRSLGKAYFGRGVEGRRTLAMQMPSKDAAVLRENVLRAMGEAQSHSVTIPGKSGVTQRQIAVALATMRKWNVTNSATCAKAIKRCGARVGKTVGHEKKRQQKEYARLKSVEVLADKIGLFGGIGKSATRATRIRELEAEVAKGMNDAQLVEELDRLRVEENATKPALAVPSVGGSLFNPVPTEEGPDEAGGAGREYTPVHKR